MKKKISMQYLLEHAEEENLERIARDYPAPESRKKDLFSEFAESETFEAVPVKRFFRWNTVISVTAVVIFILGQGILLKSLPRLQVQHSAEKAVIETTSSEENIPEETFAPTTDTKQMIFNQTEKTTVPAVTMPEPNMTVYSTETETELLETDLTEFTEMLTEETTFTETVPLPEETEFVPIAETIPETTEPVNISLSFPNFRVRYDEGCQKYYLDPIYRPVHIGDMRTRYLPTWLPDGYELSDKSYYDDVSEADPTRIRVYLKNNQQGITFYQYDAYVRNSYCAFGFHSEQELAKKCHPVLIGCWYGYIFTDDTDTILVWCNKDYQFELVGEDISEEELMQVANSVQIESIQLEEGEFMIPDGFQIRYEASRYQEGGMKYIISPAYADPLSETFLHYHPSWMPEEFEEKSFIEREDATFALYAKDNQQTISFLQYHMTATEAKFEFETLETIESSVKPVVVNGSVGYLITGQTFGRSDSFNALYGLESQGLQDGCFLVWLQGNYECILSGEDISEEELIKIAESVQ